MCQFVLEQTAGNPNLYLKLLCYIFACVTFHYRGADYSLLSLIYFKEQKMDLKGR